MKMSTGLYTFWEVLIPFMGSEHTKEKGPKSEAPCSSLRLEAPGQPWTEGSGVGQTWV